MATNRPNPFLTNHHKKREAVEITAQTKTAHFKKPKSQSRNTRHESYSRNEYHRLYRIRPGQTFLEVLANSTQNKHTSPPIHTLLLKRKTTKNVAFKKWFFVYIPIVVLALYTFFLICKVLLKKVAYAMLFEDSPLPMIESINKAASIHQQQQQLNHQPHQQDGVLSVVSSLSSEKSKIEIQKNIVQSLPASSFCIKNLEIV